MSSVMICRYNQLKSLSSVDFSCVFNVGRWSLIHWSLIIEILINNFKVYGDNILLWLFYAIFRDIWCERCFYHYDLLFSLLFDQHFLQHNCQCKLVQNISYDKLNHGYAQSQFCLWHWNNCSVCFWTLLLSWGYLEVIC